MIRPGAARIGGTLQSNGTRNASFGLTLGHVGNGWAGFIHLGSDHGGIDSRGGLFHVDLNGDHHGNYDGHHFYPYAYHHYPYAYYYNHYRPIYYSYPYYEPFYGYSYRSLYYERPYIYRSYAADDYYYDDGYYADAPVESYDDSVDGAAAAQSAASRTEPLGPYPTLPGVQDQSLVGQGSTAFAEGRFDEARSFFARAMLADERDGHPKLLYAMANFALGDYEVAATALRRALLTTSTLLEYPPDVRAFYGDVSLWDAHLSGLAAYAAANRARRSEQLLLSYLYFATGDTGRALVHLAPITQSDPTDDVAALLLDALTKHTNRK